MAYSGRINYINLAEPVETRIKQSVQYSEIVNDLTSTSDKTVPSSALLKVINDKVDGISNVSIVTDGTVPTFGDLPPASDNLNKVYVTEGKVYISNGTEWIPQGMIQGPQGEQGPAGSGLELSGSAMTVEELPIPNPLGNGATYLVNNKIWVYDEVNNKYIVGGTAGYGESAYDVAVSNGFIGTEQEWITSLKGSDGLDGSIGLTGADGKSAYQVALDNGFVGTEAQWLESLKSDGAVLPISANDVTETSVRQFISPTLKSKITRNEEDITALSQVLDGFNTTINNANLTDEKIKFDAYDVAGYLTDKIDGITIARSGNKLVAKSIEGVTVEFSKINLLTGATTNIQDQINSLSKVVNVHSIVNTKADLPAIVLEAGSTVLVRQDEDYANVSTFYVSNGTEWEYAGKINADLARDFTIQPLDIINETTGILPKTRYERQNSLETEFDGVDANFISTNAQDAIKESKLFAENGINTLATGLQDTISSLAGVKADLTITNDRLTTNEVLTTEASTLANEAKTLAQQAFQAGNSRKQSVVEKLLLVDPSLPITVDSTWEEIELAINQINSGGNVIGNKTSMITYEDTLQSGEFIRYQNKFTATDYYSNIEVSASNHVKSSNVIVLDDKILVGREIAGELSGAYLLEYKNDRIQTLANISTSTFVRNGSNIDLVKLTRNKVVQLYPGTPSSASLSLYAKVIDVSEDNKLTTTAYYNLNSTANSGFGVKGLRVRNDAFIAFHRNGTTGCFAETFIVNSNGSFTSVAKLAVSNLISNSFEAIYLDESKHKILLMGLSSADGSLVAKTIEVDPLTLSITQITPTEFIINSGVNSGVGARVHLTKSSLDKIEVCIFHNHSSNNSIGLSILDFNTSDFNPVLPVKRYENIIKSANSGMNATGNSRLTAKYHSSVNMGDNIFLLLYKNGSITEHCYIDIKQSIIVPYGIVNIKPDTNLSNDLMLLDFGNRNYGALIQNASGTRTYQGLATIVPETNLRKATTTDCISGVTNKSGVFPQQVEIIVPL